MHVPYSKMRLAIIFVCLLGGLPVSVLADQPTIQAIVTFAPQVPLPISRSTPARVVVNFEAHEFSGELSAGKQYAYWGFNHSVPGPMIRVRQNDTVEFHLRNHKNNRFPHNIDLHAVNGTSVVWTLRFTAPSRAPSYRRIGR